MPCGVDEVAVPELAPLAAAALELGVAGADFVRGTWLDSWDLFDFFFVFVKLVVYSFQFFSGEMKRLPKEVK